jgi:hypothetical protein
LAPLEGFIESYFDCGKSLVKEERKGEAKKVVATSFRLVFLEKSLDLVLLQQQHICI